MDKLFSGPLLVIMEYAEHGNLRNFLRCHSPSIQQSFMYSNLSALQPKDSNVLALPYSQWSQVIDGENIMHLTLHHLLSFAMQVGGAMEYLEVKKVNSPHEPTAPTL